MSLIVARKKLFAAVVAVVFGLVLFTYLGQVEERAVMESMISVPMLTADVTKGTVITPDLLQISLVSLVDQPDRWISGIEAIGKVAAENLPAGTILTGDHLVDLPLASEREKDPKKDPPNEAEFDKLFSVSVPRQEVAGLAPGDCIDLVGVFPSRSGRAEQSVLLAEQVRVFEISDLTTCDGEGDVYEWPQTSVIMLTVGTDQETVYRLALAEEFGKIRVIKDNVSTEGATGPSSRGLTLDSLLQTDSTSSHVHRGGGSTASGTTNAIPRASKVTVIKGTKVTHPSVP